MEIGHSSVDCASNLFSADGTTCTSCSGELLDDMVRSITPPLGTSLSTFGDATYLEANVGGFFLAVFVSVEYSFIVFACSLSSFSNGLSSFLFSVSEFSVDVETGEKSGLGRIWFPRRACGWCLPS